MNESRLLLEELLREDKLNKKSISLLVACDEQRAFACQTPTMARETVTALNTRFRERKLRPTDLHILRAFLKHCPDDIFVENCVSWILECLKVTGNQRNEENAFDIIKMSLEISSTFKNLSKPICQKVVPRLLDQLLESQKPTYSALQCLQILFYNYSEPCKAQLKSLQRYLLNFMDEEDKNLVIHAGRCLSYLPLITDNTNNQETSWTDLLSALCVAANSVLHQLFENVCEVVIPSSLGGMAEGIQLKPIESNDSILLAQLLAQRLINILIFIEGMLVGACDYVKEVQTDLIITLVNHGLSISYNMLKNSSTMWHVALISVLPDIQIHLLNLLKSFVSCCKGGLLKFGPLFCNIAIRVLTVNSSSQSPGMKLSHSKVRNAVYNFLENWVLRAKAASCVELFDEELISLIFHDLSQRKNHALNWVQELLKQYQNGQDYWQQIHTKPISTNCEAALQALCAIVLTSGSQLTLSVHKKLQDFVVSLLLEVQQSCGPEDIPAPYNVAECRLQLYQLLLFLTLHPHPHWSPPINYASSFFSRGQQDSSPEVVKLCTYAMMSIHKMVHLSSFPHQPSIEKSRTVFPFTNILTEKESEQHDISQLDSEFTKSIKICKKNQIELPLRSIKTRKRSLHAQHCGTLPKKKRFSKGFINLLVNSKALQSTDDDWIVKRISKKQSGKSKRKRKGQEISKAVDLQNTMKKRKHHQMNCILMRSKVKSHTLVYDEQDIPAETMLVDLVSDDEILDLDKNSHSYACYEDLISIDHLESTRTEDYGNILEKMEAFTKDEERRNLDQNDSRETGAGIKGTGKKTSKDVRSVCGIENDCNIGANEEIRINAEKIVIEVNKIKKNMMIDESSRSVDCIEICSDMSETKSVEEVQLPTEIPAFPEQSPNIEVLTVTDISIVDNSETLTSRPQQMLQQAADVKKMLPQNNCISLNEINPLEEHTYVINSCSDLVEFTDLTLQKENAQMKADDSTSVLSISKDVNVDKICSSGASNEVISLLKVQERNLIKTIDESSTKKQGPSAMSNEKGSSLDDSKQVPVSNVEISQLTVEERNATQTSDELSTRKQVVPAMNNHEAVSLDDSKQPVSCIEISQLKVEVGNIIKAIDESFIGKQVESARHNEKAASLDDSKQKPIPYIENIRNETEIYNIDVNEVCLLNESTEVRNIHIKSNGKGIKANGNVCTRKKENPIEDNETNIALSDDLVEMNEAESDGRKILETEVIDTTADALKMGKKNTNLSDPCVVTQMLKDDQESATLSVIHNDAGDIRGSIESVSLVEHEVESAVDQNIREELQMERKEKNISDSTEEHNYKTSG